MNNHDLLWVVAAVIVTVAWGIVGLVGSALNRRVKR
jgi:hypothetical protein